jgi:hypothetical protein
MENWALIAIRLVGIACIVLAIAGYGYTYISYIASKGVPFDPDAPYFKMAYFTMISVCLI